MMLKEIDAIPEGDGTLLDHSLVFAYSDQSFAKIHAVDGIPIFVRGQRQRAHENWLPYRWWRQPCITSRADRSESDGPSRSIVCGTGSMENQESDIRNCLPSPYPAVIVSFLSRGILLMLSWTGFRRAAGSALLTCIAAIGIGNAAPSVSELIKFPPGQAARHGRSAQRH